MNKEENYLHQPVFLYNNNDRDRMESLLNNNTDMYIHDRPEQGVTLENYRYFTPDNGDKSLFGLLNNRKEVAYSPLSITPPRKSRLCSIKCCGICILITLMIVLSLFGFCLYYFSPAPLPKIPNVPTYYRTYPRILTQNIFMRPIGVKNNEDDYKDERLNYIIQEVLPDYDIITMQEAFAFSTRRIDKLIRAAFDQGFHYSVSSPRHYPWDLAGDGGLLLLSRYPIIQNDRIEFPPGTHSDRLSRKGALHALIQLDKSHFIHVYTTHTQASYDIAGSLNTEDTKVRLDQFHRVHNFISGTTKNDTYPIILMGDLNVNAANPKTNKSTVNIPSYESSLAYKMMVDVLRGKGTDLNLLNSIGSTSSVNTTDVQLTYSDERHMDKLEDIVYSTYGYHPVTFGDYKQLDNGTFVPRETVLTNHDQLLTVQSIDRMFLLNDRPGRTNNSRLTVFNVTIAPFFVDPSRHLPFTQISDHYGLSALIQLQS